METAKFGLTLNIKKTEVMSNSPLRDFAVDGEGVEIVGNFIFLGSGEDKDGQCAGEVKRRLIPGRKAFINLGKILKDKDISLATKISDAFFCGSVWM